MTDAPAGHPRWMPRVSRVLRQSLVRVLVAAGLFCGLAAAAQEPGAARDPASAPTAASGAAEERPRTAFDVVTAGPVTLGAPDSPRASLAHYFEAVRLGRWDAAARFLVLDPQQQPRGAQLARRLKAIIDDTGWIDLDTVSDAREGRADDGLPPLTDEVDRVTLDGRTEPLRMVRRSDEQGVHWAFSPSTVQRIDAWYAKLPDRGLRDIFVKTGMDMMLTAGPLELLWWQWFAIAALVLVAWLGGSLAGRVTRWMLRRATARTAATWDDELVACLGGPLTLAWTLSLLVFGSRHLLLLKPAYQLIEGLTTAGVVLAVFWAIWRAAGVAVRQMMSRPWAQASGSARTLVSVGGNFARGAILFAGVLAVLSALGYPIGTVLAGLGIGGLALAFGAQKTIENLFGSVALAVDQPFQVGDLVKVDGITGTVENIGLRSTRLRTAERTLISIPNGKLADQRTESFAARDRFRFELNLGLAHGTTEAQMRQVLSGIEAVLRAHPKIWPDDLSVHLTGIGASTLDIEVRAWFAVTSSGDFQGSREEVLLSIMKVVHEAGAGFAVVP